MFGRHRAKVTAQKLQVAAIHAAEHRRAERHGDDQLPEPHWNHRYRHLLMPEFLDYVARVSWADHAVSIGTAAVIAELCEKRRPARVLDTGSGFSSYVLRRYARERGADVVSVDDDAAWLEKTRSYLQEHDLDGLGELTTWDLFDPASCEPFDLIFHDMGNLDTRVQTMATVDGLVSPNGVVIYDDVVIPTVRAEAKRLCAANGRRYFSLRDATLDEMTRYSALSLPPLS